MRASTIEVKLKAPSRVATTDGEERGRFCSAAGLPPIHEAVLTRQRPDALRVVRRAEAVLARCALWWRRTPPYPGHRVGLIGHYAARDATAAATLLTEACSELASHKCTLAVGPVDGSTWGSYRLVVERGPERPFFLEPDTPDEWSDHFVDAGFGVLARYHSALRANLAELDPAARDIERRLMARGIEVSSLDTGDLEGELRRIHVLTLLAFREHQLFMPLKLDAFLAQYLDLRSLIRSELVLVARQRARVVGYLFALPDVLQAQRGEAVDTIIIKTLAVHPELRGWSGLGRLLAARCHETALALGYTRAIHALMEDDGPARTLSRHRARPIRRYALFARHLDSRTPDR